MEKSNFQFKRPVIKRLLFSINNNFDKEKYNGIEVEGYTTIKRSNDEKNAIVNFELKIGDESKEVPFFIDLEMSARFMWNDDLSKDKQEKLLSVNAPSLIVSYMRPIISNITSNSQFPSFDLPFIDMRNNKLTIEK